jgi:hypothetical protein
MRNPPLSRGIKNLGFAHGDSMERDGKKLRNKILVSIMPELPGCE